MSTSYMFRPSRGYLQADILNTLGSFYLRTSDVHEVPRGEGQLGSRFGGWGLVKTEF
jgi:hypothetical protein